MPTYEVPERAYREFQRLRPEQRRLFVRALGEFVEALRQHPPALPPRLRIKRVQGHPKVWELTFAPDGRATFSWRGASGSRARDGDPGHRRRGLTGA